MVTTINDILKDKNDEALHPHCAAESFICFFTSSSLNDPEMVFSFTWATWATWATKSKSAREQELMHFALRIQHVYTYCTYWRIIIIVLG